MRAHGVGGCVRAARRYDAEGAACKRAEGALATRALVAFGAVATRQRGEEDDFERADGEQRALSVTLHEQRQDEQRCPRKEGGTTHVTRTAQRERWSEHA